MGQASNVRKGMFGELAVPQVQEADSGVEAADGEGEDEGIVNHHPPEACSEAQRGGWVAHRPLPRVRDEREGQGVAEGVAGVLQDAGDDVGVEDG